MEYANGQQGKLKNILHKLNKLISLIILMNDSKLGRSQSPTLSYFYDNFLLEIQ